MNTSLNNSNNLTKRMSLPSKPNGNQRYNKRILPKPKNGLSSSFSGEITQVQFHQITSPTQPSQIIFLNPNNFHNLNVINNLKRQASSSPLSTCSSMTSNTASTKTTSPGMMTRNSSKNTSPSVSSSTTLSMCSSKTRSSNSSTSNSFKTTTSNDFSTSNSSSDSVNCFSSNFESSSASSDCHSINRNSTSFSSSASSSSCSSAMGSSNEEFIEVVKKGNKRQKSTSSMSSSPSKNNTNDNSVCSTSNCSSFLNSSDQSSTYTRTTRTSLRSCASNDTDSQSCSTRESNNTKKIRCQWKECTYTCESDRYLIDHVQTKHVYSQSNRVNDFNCLWNGCKNYSERSISFEWMKRHVLEHVDPMPYACVFNGCEKKFRTDKQLQTHCESHFNSKQNVNGNSSKNVNCLLQSNQISPIKTRNNLLKTAERAIIENLKNKNNNGKVLAKIESENGVKNGNGKPNELNGGTNRANGENRLQNVAQIIKALNKKKKLAAQASDIHGNQFKKAQFKDYLDPISVRVIDFKLKNMNYDSGNVTFNASIIASRINDNTGQESYLIEWIPRNIIGNEWVDKNNLKMTKTMSSLELARSGCLLDKNPFYNSHRFRANRRK